jgi:selenide, water dikinase
MLKPAADSEAPEQRVRLTQFSHGGGCGCKISPAVLSEILATTPLRTLPKDLLVGIETGDDAAVYRLNDQQAIVATTDFFTPIVDDAFDFGRIAATNAISDVYAMGGRPIFALALVGMPLDKLPIDAIQQVIAGGESVCAAAGIPVAGGHSIDTLEPIYGLVVIGIAHPANIKRNSSAQAGDILILGKPLGVGILSAALKQRKLSVAGYEQMLATTTQLNTPGVTLAELPGVHAMTDVTGFGLGGHMLGLCRGAGLSAQLRVDEVPVMEEALAWARQGVATGASARNWTSYGHDVVCAHDLPGWQRSLLTDPQTSGGLLVSCSPEVGDQVLEIFKDAGFARATRIGVMTHGDAVVTLC